ncbi:transcription factor 7-like 1-B isoform X2 [Festucalex cinctus]
MDRAEFSDQLVVDCHQDRMGDTPDLSSSPDFSWFCDPPEENVYTELQTVEGEVDGLGVWLPLGKMLEVPTAVMTMTPALEPPYCPSMMLPYSQGLSLPYEWSATPFDSQLEEAPAVMMQPMDVGLSTIGHVNGDREEQDNKNKSETYIKKPLNAFMLFRQEQRPKVVALLNIRNSADVNKVVGQMWKSLTKKEQRKYYELADAEKLLHTQRHPDWSCTDNYGKKRKRKRAKLKGRSQEETCQTTSPNVATCEIRSIKQGSQHTEDETQKQLRVMLEFML